MRPRLSARWTLVAERGRGQLVDAAAGPVERGDVGERPLLALVDAGGGSRVVHGQHLAILHHLPAGDEHVAHGPLGGGIDQAAQRLAAGLHHGVPEVDQHHVRLGADGEAADVAAPEQPGAAERGAAEDVAAGHVERRLGGDARVDAGVAHLLHHVVGIGVGADADVDAGLQVAAEVAQRHAAAREHRRAVGDRGAGSASRPRSVRVPQRTQGWWSRKMPWPIEARGPR